MEYGINKFFVLVFSWDLLTIRKTDYYELYSLNYKE